MIPSFEDYSNILGVTVKLNNTPSITEVTDLLIDSEFFRLVLFQTK